MGLHRVCPPTEDVSWRSAVRWRTLRLRASGSGTARTGLVGFRESASDLDKSEDMLALTIAGATIAVATLLGHAGAAHLSCEADDKSLKFVAEGIVSRGVGEVFVSFKAEADVLAKTAPVGLRKVEFTGEHLTQRWAYGKALKLRLYRDEPGGSVEMVIEAQAGRDGLEHRGRCVLTLQEGQGKPITLRGA